MIILTVHRIHELVVIGKIIVWQFMLAVLLKKQLIIVNQCISPQKQVARITLLICI